MKNGVPHDLRDQVVDFMTLGRPDWDCGRAVVAWAGWRAASFSTGRGAPAKSRSNNV